MLARCYQHTLLSPPVGPRGSDDNDDNFLRRFISSVYEQHDERKCGQDHDVPVLHDSWHRQSGTNLHIALTRPRSCCTRLLCIVNSAL